MLRIVPGAVETRALESEDKAHEEPSRHVNKIGRYLLVEELGRGGMGVVWTAYDPKLDRKVAIKLLRSSAQTSVRKARFIREAQTLARLSHPNIVTVHDVDVHRGQLYMAMEYVAGQTLEQWLKGRPSWRETLDVFDHAGQGLAAAHAAGITHRDFKPSNVLIAEDGQVKVLDFGLAKYMDSAARDSVDSGRYESVDGETQKQARDSQIMEVLGSTPRDKLTKVGRIVGTPAYMAPEQYVPLGPNPISEKTDQFSFAVTLYEALYGRLPFDGRDLFEICDKVQEGQIREPSRDSDVPGWLLRVLRRSMHAEPDQRYRSMSELLAELRADPSRRRRRALTYIVGTGLLGLGAFGVVQALSAGDEGPRPCQGAQERFLDVWDDQARASVEHGLVATGRPFAADTARRVAEGFDDYAATWIEQHTAICEATRVHGEQSEALLDVRMTCLDRRRAEFGALVGVLATAREDTVIAAVGAVAGLRPPGSCATAQPRGEDDVPTEPVRRAEFMALRDRLDEATALAAAGRHAEARQQAAAAGKSAEGLGFRRLLAEALVVEGTAYQKLREHEAARERLMEGIAVASEVGDADIEFSGWNSLLYTVGVQLDEVDRSADWLFTAQNALRRAEGSWRQQADLALNVGAVMLKQNRLEEAGHAGENVLRIVYEATGSESLQYAQALNNLGITAAKGADWALAETRLRESLDLKKRILGPGHPEVASNAMNLANVLVQHARRLQQDEAAANMRYDEAEALYEEVVSLREQIEGPKSKNVARTLANLGQLQRRRSKLAEAEASLERAVNVLRAVPDAGDDLANTLLILAKHQRVAGNYAVAEALYREIIALQQQRHGDRHPSVASTRVQLCRSLIGMERYADAIAECEHAIKFFRSNPDDSTSTQLSAAQQQQAKAREALANVALPSSGTKY